MVLNALCGITFLSENRKNVRVNTTKQRYGVHSAHQNTPKNFGRHTHHNPHTIKHNQALTLRDVVDGPVHGGESHGLRDLIAGVAVQRVGQGEGAVRQIREVRLVDHLDDL